MLNKGKWLLLLLILNEIAMSEEKANPQCCDPQSFWHQGLVSWKTNFPWTRGWGMVSE